MHEIFRDVAVIPVLTIARASDAVPLAEALSGAGLRVIEITLRTPAAPAAIEEIRRRLPDVIVGAGALLTPADVGRAVSAGARFLVSPGVTPDLAAAGLASERPYLPGVVTPSEILAARDLGLSLLRFFPATAASGVEMLAAYAPVFPGIAFYPTGGVDQAKAAAYLALPNVAMVGGDWMAPADLAAAGDWRKIEALARQAAALKRA
jgi:2-dehydro-3-deoxyphosphogluconate aldolase/(4S)-4-hydroxy-2-oxoglutarate aldolase